MFNKNGELHKFSLTQAEKSSIIGLVRFKSSRLTGAMKTVADGTTTGK